MRRVWLFVAATLGACAARPTGIELTITPEHPGDAVDLYFGTTKGPNPLSVKGLSFALDEATYYSADQLGPHTIITGDKASVIYVEQQIGAPPLGFVLALEQSNDKLSAAAVEITDPATSSYALTLVETRSNPAGDRGSFAAQWSAMPDATYPDDQCEYFVGNDAAGNAINAAIVIETDTVTSANDAYADHDCDGYPAGHHPAAAECDDGFYDSQSQPPTLDDAQCASFYAQSAGGQYCYATAPACTDGLPITGCPNETNPAMADNVSSYCVPTDFCGCPDDLGCTLKPANATPFETCEITVNSANGDQVCDMYNATVPLPPAAVALIGDQCATTTLAVGLAGGFGDSVAVNGVGVSLTIGATMSTDCSMVNITASGTWGGAVQRVLLAITPMQAPAIIVAFDLTAPTSEGCNLTDPVCLPVSTMTADPALDDCLGVSESL